MLDLNNIAQTAADKYAEGLDKYNENTKTESEPLEEPNEKEEINTSWLDDFSNRDNDRSEFAANDRVDTSIQPEALKEETVFGGESSSKPEDVYDTSYLDEAFSNFNTWQQQAEEDARKGRQLAYTNKELEKAKEGFANTEWTAPTTKGKSTFSDALYGGLSDLITSDADKARATQLLRDRATEVLEEVRSGKISADEAIKKFNDADFYKENNISTAAGSGTASNLLEQLKTAAPKAEDIAKYGETKLPNMTAKQEAENYEKTNLAPIAKRINNAIEKGDIAEAEKALELYKKEYANASPAIKAYDNSRPDSDSMKPEGFANEIEYAKGAAEPAAPAATSRATSDAVTNEFNEMFANPNTDALEEYTGITKEELPDNVEDAIDKAAANPEDAEHWNILNGLKGKYGDKVDSAINWVQKNLYLHEVPKPEMSNSDSDSTTETVTSKEDNTPTTVEPTTETQGIESVIPQEVIANNPEALEDIQEFITNGDSGGLAQYLLNLLGSTALTVIEHAMLSGKENDPTLQDALKEVWERMPASEKSGLDKERISAINNAFKAEPSNLKAVGISSEDTSATNESDYNKGMTEQTNEIVSDRTKKYVLSNPWILAAIRKW